MQGRAAAVVAAPGQVRQISEVSGCAVAPAGEGLRSAMDHKRYAPIVVPAQDRGRDVVEVSDSDPAEAGQWALAEVRRPTSDQAAVLAEVVDSG